LFYVINMYNSWVILHYAQEMKEIS
jgi:hypothetical protein